MASKSSTPETNEPDKSDEQPAKVKHPRVTILGFSATAVLKWMGANGWKREEAEKVIQKLAEGGEVKPATITTGLSDGRSEKYRKGAAPITPAQAKQLKAAAK